MLIRKALEGDLENIVAMLADDKLGALREDYQIPLPQSYLDAFQKINGDPNQLLMVAEMGDEIIATFQLSFIPYLTFKGGERAQIEAVRVKKNHRGKGIGRKLFEWAISAARERGCHLVQLTTNKDRDRAQDFYQELGFDSTHEGMKLYLKKW